MREIGPRREKELDRQPRSRPDGRNHGVQPGILPRAPSTDPQEVPPLAGDRTSQTIDRQAFTPGSADDPAAGVIRLPCAHSPWIGSRARSALAARRHKPVALPGMDLLLTHGYFLTEDETEKRILKPYPPLGILYLSSYLKARGIGVSVFDTTFKSFPGFSAYIAGERPPVVGISSNLLTKLNVLKQIRCCKEAGCRVIVGGPDVPEYAEQYVASGADAAVIGEGEETTFELLEALSKGGPTGSIRGIVFRSDDGQIVGAPDVPEYAEQYVASGADAAVI